MGQDDFLRSPAGDNPRRRLFVVETGQRLGLHVVGFQDVNVGKNLLLARPGVERQRAIGGNRSDEALGVEDDSPAFALECTDYIEANLATSRGVDEVHPARDAVKLSRS